MTHPNDPYSPVVAVPFATTTQSQQILGPAGILAGFAVIETTGVAACAFDLIDGHDANGSPLVPVSLQAGQSRSDWFGPWGVAVQSGLFLSMLSGSVRGVLFLVDQ